jgi:hypothetical protein
MAAAVPAFAATTVQTVWVIAMENHNWTQPNPTSNPQQIMGNAAAPFINSLVTPGNANAVQTSYASDYFNAGVGVHPSEPNYIWAEAGTNFNKDTNTTNATDADPSVAANNIFSTTPHLGSQMNAAGVSWKNYQEDYQILNNSTLTGGVPTISKSGTGSSYTNPYYLTNQYNYAAKHNPYAFFTDTANSASTFDQLRSDIAADTVSVSNPTATNNFGKYNWITPNQYNDMHSSLSTAFNYAGQTWAAGTDQEAIAIGDNFLATIVPQIMATQAYKNNGAIVIWFDESESGDTPSQAIPEIVISPLAKGNAFNSTVQFNHSSDIKTMEELFGLGSYLNNTIPTSETNVSGVGYNTVSGSNDLSDMFKAGAIPSAVPEPASLGVMGVGALLLIRRRK